MFRFFQQQTSRPAASRYVSGSRMVRTGKGRREPLFGTTARQVSSPWGCRSVKRIVLWCNGQPVIVMCRTPWWCRRIQWKVRRRDIRVLDAAPNSGFFVPCLCSLVCCINQEDRERRMTGHRLRQRVDRRSECERVAGEEWPIGFSSLSLSQWVLWILWVAERNP